MAHRNVPALVQPAPQRSLLNFWREEIVNLAYHLVKSQVIQDQDTENLIEGLISQYTPQSVLNCWIHGECWQNTVLAKLARLSDAGLSKLGTGDASMSKVCWVVVSDSGLIAISGGRKNRMKYEMIDEFQKKKPAYNEELVYRPLWGKTLRPLAYEVRTAIDELHEKYGRQNTQIHGSCLLVGKRIGRTNRDRRRARLASQKFECGLEKQFMTKSSNPFGF